MQNFKSIAILITKSRKYCNKYCEISKITILCNTIGTTSGVGGCLSLNPTTIMRSKYRFFKLAIYLIILDTKKISIFRFINPHKVYIIINKVAADVTMGTHDVFMRCSIMLKIQLFFFRIGKKIL